MQIPAGVHIVTVPSAGMVMYLQPEAIICPLKAAVRDDTILPVISLFSLRSNNLMMRTLQ